MNLATVANKRERRYGGREGFEASIGG